MCVIHLINDKLYSIKKEYTKLINDKNIFKFFKKRIYPLEPPVRKFYTFLTIIDCFQKMKIQMNEIQQQK